MKTNLVNPFDFDHPTEFLKSLVESFQERNPQLSLRAICLRLRLSDVSILSGLLRGKRAWSISYGLAMAECLGFSAEQRIYLELMILRDLARTKLEFDCYDRQIKETLAFEAPRRQKRKSFKVFIVGSHRLSSQNGELKGIELRRHEFHAESNLLIEEVYRLDANERIRLKHHVEIGNPESRVYAPTFAEPGTSVTSIVGGQIQSAFFKVAYGAPGIVEWSTVGQNSWAVNRFTAILNNYDAKNQLIAKDICSGLYVSQSGFEDLLADLDNEDPEIYQARLRRVLS